MEREKHIVVMPRRAGSRTMASARKPAGVQEEGAKRKREAEEEKERCGAAKARRDASWGLMLKQPAKGGSPLKAAIKVGPKALDKMTGGREGRMGQGSAPHRTRERKRKRTRDKDETGEDERRVCVLSF